MESPVATSSRTGTVFKIDFQINFATNKTKVEADKVSLFVIKSCFTDNHINLHSVHKGLEQGVVQFESGNKDTCVETVKVIRIYFATQSHRKWF